MEKNEILEKSKKENKRGDERYVQAYNESAKLAMSIGVLACGLINLICVIVSSVSIVLYVTNTIMISMWFSLYVSLAIKCKKRSDIILCVVFGVILLAFIVMLAISLFI